MGSLDCAGAVLRIDLNALVENYRIIARRVAPAEVAGVVKADAYGTGASAVASALLDAGCRRFFVAQLNEALALRPDLPGSAQLFVLNGLQPGNETHDALARDDSPARRGPVVDGRRHARTCPECPHANTNSAWIVLVYPLPDRSDRDRPRGVDAPNASSLTGV